MSHVKSVVNHPIFERFIIFVILLSAVVVGLETSQSIYSQYGDYLKLHLNQIESREKQITNRLQAIEDEISKIKEIV